MHKNAPAAIVVYACKRGARWGAHQAHESVLFRLICQDSEVLDQFAGM